MSLFEAIDPIFRGHAKHRLFITASTSVYSVVLNREGVQRA